MRGSHEADPLFSRSRSSDHDAHSRKGLNLSKLRSHSSVEGYERSSSIDGNRRSSWFERTSSVGSSAIGVDRQHNYVPDDAGRSSVSSVSISASKSARIEWDIK
jgi:hypothetical protein